MPAEKKGFHSAVEVPISLSVFFNIFVLSEVGAYSGIISDC